MNALTAKRIGALAALAWMTGNGAVQACYSGLFLIPTADLVPKSAYSFEYQLDGTIKRCRADTHFLNTEFGLSDRIEFGVDFDVSSAPADPALLNAKCVLFDHPKTPLKIAAGVYGFTEHSEETPYVVASADCSVARVHAGAMRIADKERAFFGVDKSLNDRVTLMADWTDGSDNWTSLGFCYNLGKGVSVMAGGLFPNSGGDTGFSVHFVFTGP